MRRYRDIVYTVAAYSRRFFCTLLSGFMDVSPPAWTFRPKTFRPLPIWTFRLLDVSPHPRARLAPARFAPWTIRPLDDSPHARGRFARELSFLGVSPSRCGRTEDVLPHLGLSMFSQVVTACINRP